MKRWIVILISLLFLSAALILLWRFPVRNILNIQKENNQTLLELKEEIGQIKNQFDLLKPIVPLPEEDTVITWENKEIIEEEKANEEIKITTPEVNKVENIEETQKEINSTPTTNIVKKIWYINKIYKNDSIAKVSFDEIVILPKEQCEWLEICFKNENKRTTTFSLSNDIEIYSYFINYVISWEIRKTKKIFLPCFLEFFAEDDADNYTRFNKIPYWITIENGQITKIEEQNVVGLYK